MLTALTGSTRAASAALLVAWLLTASRSLAETGATLSPSAVPATPSPGPAVAPTPQYDNYLGKIIAHASTREGYTVPIVQLQRLGARTIGDVLQFVPGALVRQTGTEGALQTVALRGNSASQTLILLDGRPVNEGDTGVTDFTSMPLDGVQTIRVIEGGLSSQYGSGAIGGVVEITTKKPSGNSGSGYAQIGYQGAFGAGAGVSAGNQYGGIRVDAFTRYAENTFDYPGFQDILAGTRSNNDAHLTDLTLCACYDFVHPNHALSVDYHLNDNTTDVGAPGSTQFGPAFVSTLARQERYVLRNSLNLAYNTANSSTTAIVYVDGRRLHFYDPTPPFPFDEETTATQRGFSIQERWAISSANIVTAKYEQNGTVADFAPLTARDSTTDLYIGDEYAAHRGGPQIDAAMQFAHTQGTPSTMLPNIAISQQVGGHEDWYGTAIRASYARSFRAPNLDELYFPGFGNPTLQPEYATTFDVGVRTEDQSVSASANLFGSDTNNLIVNQAIDTMGDFLPFNVGRAQVRGYDVQVSNTFNRRIGWQLAYTAYPTAKDLSTAPDINGVITTDNRLLYRPTTTTGFGIWRRAGYDPQPVSAVGEDGIDLLVIGRQYADEENVHLLPPYATLGFHVLRNLDKHVSLLLRVNNVTGERVPQTYGYPVLGRTFIVRLSSN